MTQDYAAPPGNKDGEGASKTTPIIGGVCCVLVTVIIAVLVFVAKNAGDEFVKKHLQWTTNLTMCETGDGEWTEPPWLAKKILGQKPKFNCRRGHGHLLTPANYSKAIDFICAPPKMIKALAEFNAEAGWKLLEFPSRKGHHGQYHGKDAGWWLPVADPKAPRIVVQHGNNVNFNDNTVTVVAYLLRSMGFACLLPNFRDHGLSATSDHNSVGWGYDYHLDLLGAWDYTVKDPDGKLGGPMNKDKVGLLGFSMGGFVTSTSFGLEPGVPGAWIDSGVFEPSQTLGFIMGQNGIGFLQGLAWYFAKKTAGVDLELWSPSKSLPGAFPVSKPRPIAVTQGQQDDTVPPFQSENLVKLINSTNKGEHGKLYDLKEFYKPDYKCLHSNPKKKNSTHCTMHLWKPDVYREKLCDFWTGVFGMSKEDCGIANLPKFEEVGSDPPTDAPAPALQARQLSKTIL